MMTLFIGFIFNVSSSIMSIWIKENVKEEICKKSHQLIKLLQINKSFYRNLSGNSSYNKFKIFIIRIIIFTRSSYLPTFTHKDIYIKHIKKLFKRRDVGLSLSYLYFI
ncbi:hypothetical protein STK_07110 [Sulfurisphaera tokodaii str. 7]|uniref:Uncharacterized protein n=1 Tax=Sulfurisphaera tokodaii (strain DSM 16993 / JCM 10545 / NBRC 100140 / 7) TaxID=273063 RepID=Q974E0_SULTO|nr:hypothetical protein STK_07110 [Sulfurisphaera tokodaii str. 7]